MRPTPSQTIGPFFAPGFDWLPVPEGAPLQGRILDGAGAPVGDAVVEAWQPPRFARSLTDGDGRWSVGVAPGEPVWLSVFARGLLQRLVTRVYLDGGTDEVLASVPTERRATLQAVPEGDGFRFDIRLQGPEETVFFAW